MYFEYNHHLHCILTLPPSLCLPLFSTSCLPNSCAFYFYTLMSLIELVGISMEVRLLIGLWTTYQWLQH